MNNPNEYRVPKLLDLDVVLEIIQKHYYDFLDNGGVIGVNFTFQTDPKGRDEFDLETVHLYTNHPGIVIGTKGGNGERTGRKDSGGHCRIHQGSCA